MKLSTLRQQFYPVLLLTVVVFASVAMLALTNNVTEALIEYQIKQEILRMLQEIFPDMSRYTFENEIYTIYSDGDEIGYGFLATGKGYGGDIDILIGLNTDMMVKGVTIVSHTETPGLGDRIVKPSFTDRFIGLEITDVAVPAEGGKVDAISGSTISSKAVIDAVRTTAMEKAKALTGKNSTEK